jgi:hypothetical protein
MKTVNNPDLERIVRRLANQCPTRYYLDGKGDGTYTHRRLEIWLPRNASFPDFLSAELDRYGFEPVQPWMEANTGDFVVYQWIALRTTYPETG